MISYLCDAEPREFNGGLGVVINRKRMFGDQQKLDIYNSADDKMAANHNVPMIKTQE